MPTDTTTPPGHDPAPAPTRQRLHPRAVGTLAALVALVAAVAAAFVYDSVVGEGSGGAEPELELRLGPGDADGAQPTEHVHPPEVTGEALPARTFPLLDGGDASFADYRGRPLVVNVWSATCPPCLQEMPALEQVSREHAGHVAFVGIALRDDEDTARDWLARTGVTYDIGLDRSGEIVEAIGAVGLPSTLFVDADGAIVGTKTGAMSLDEIRRRVGDLLG